jgi:ribosomal protein S18 acetylase RimI-like enzyme
MIIRPCTDADADPIWGMLEPVLRAGESYALPRDWTRVEALGYWCGADHAVFVAEEAGQVIGTYYLHKNQKGGGAHVANCGYITHERAAGRGVGRAMCVHSLLLAAQRGFKAMQFNFVVSTNERAIALWKVLGFEVVGRLPGAYEHPTLSFVDALVMYRKL